MSEQLKWADVAHMYAKADFKVRIKQRDCDETFLMVSNRNIGGSYLEKYVSDGIYWKAYGAQFVAWDEHKPILRHLEDMTEADAEDLYKFIHGDDGGEYNAYRCLQWAKQVFKRQDFTPLIVYWLTSRGFDIYRLIESGEAIREEASNG